MKKTRIKETKTPCKYLMLPAIAAALLAGCQTAGVKEAPVTAQLAPMEAPIYNVGYKVHRLKDGKPTVGTLTVQKGDKNTWTTSEGCESTRIKDIFAPGNEWKGCDPYTDGTQTFVQEGTVWPLTVGKTWSYAIDGSNVEGNDWSGTRKCEVEGVARITTGIGDHDTYKVVCRDPWGSRTFYMSPEMGEAVSHMHRRTRQGQTIRYELIKQEHAGT